MSFSPICCCIHRLVEAQTEKTPRAPAVVFGERSLTYEELNRRANCLAAYLRTFGVRRKVLVGLFLGRSDEMVVALLAVLKAGAAYVPLDPAFPKDRLEWMVEDSAAPVILTNSWLVPDLPESTARIVCMDTEQDAISAESSANLAGSVGDGAADDLAYVIYTSGSTGKPKGVQIPHGAVVNFLESMSSEPGLSERDTLLAITTLSFDIAVLEIFLPLVVGARVVIVSRETAADGIALARLIIRSQATVVQATPATWRLLLTRGWKGRTGLKILCGGEPLPRPLANQLLRRCDSLWNMYGPTETTVWSTIHRVQRGNGPVPIGRPIAQTQAYVLGDDLQPVPAGEAGELYLGGAGLARGYRNRLDLTVERFVPDPHGEPDARMYRTGDRARVLPDGTLECLGRVDHQVKIRGFRIELGEIESVLVRHPAVREAVVVAREVVSGEKRLAAYVGLRPGHTATVREFGDFLRTTLPEYMVPADFVAMASLPLTPNGKVDRQALPPPAAVLRASSFSETAVPRNLVEKRLTRIFERILSIQPIGLKDNFFDLGVNSLTAAALFVQIEKEFGRRLPSGPLFLAPTIEQMAALLRSNDVQIPWSSLVRMQPNGTKPPLFCVHGGGGTILHFYPLVRRLGLDQPVYGLQRRGLYGKEVPHTRIEEMSEHYLNEIRSVQPHGPYHLVGYCFGAIVAYEMAQRLLAQGEQVAALVALNGPSPDYIRRHRQRLTSEEDLRVATRAQGRHINRPSPRPTYAYLTNRIASGIGWRIQRARLQLEKFRRKMRMRLGMPMADSVRDEFFLTNSNKAELEYVPKHYPGRMLQVRGRGLYTDPLLGWSELIGGGIESYEVPGDHENARNLLREPSVGVVAEWLAAYIDRTRPQTESVLDHGECECRTTVTMGYTEGRSQTTIPNFSELPLHVVDN